MNHVLCLKSLISGRTFTTNEIDYVDPAYGADGVVDVVYDYDLIGRHITRESLRENRDETIWPDAAKFDPDRFVARGVPGSHYSPFGFHRHACNGVDLNNLICRVILEEMATGFDWSITRDGELERDFRHWSHWRPSRDLAIAITARHSSPGLRSPG